MARMALDPSARAAKVLEAHAALGALLQLAQDTTAQHGPTDARTHAAWTHVEEHGATIHRQARLLAGKSKGG